MKSATVWAKARKAALARDRDRCVIKRPGCHGWAIHVHHIDRRRGPDQHRLDHLASCCLNCHTWVHNNVADAVEAGWLLRSGPIDRVLYTRRPK